MRDKRERHVNEHNRHTCCRHDDCGRTGSLFHVQKNIIKCHIIITNNLHNISDSLTLSRARKLEIKIEFTLTNL